MIFLPGIPFLFGGGAGSNIFYYIAGGSELYKGITFTGPHESAYFDISDLIVLQANSISSSPVKKQAYLLHLRINEFKLQFLCKLQHNPFQAHVCRKSPQGKVFLGSQAAVHL